MLTITLKSGIVHKYPDAQIDLDTALSRMNKQIVWYLETEKYIEVYRTSEIAHITIDKGDRGIKQTIPMKK